MLGGGGNAASAIPTLEMPETKPAWVTQRSSSKKKIVLKNTLSLHITIVIAIIMFLFFFFLWGGVF